MKYKRGEIVAESKRFAVIVDIVEYEKLTYLQKTRIIGWDERIVHSAGKTVYKYVFLGNTDKPDYKELMAYEFFSIEKRTYI